MAAMASCSRRCSAMAARSGNSFASLLCNNMWPTLHASSAEFTAASKLVSGACSVFRNASISSGQLNRRHSQPLDVSRVTDRSHPDTIVDLEKFLPPLTEGEEQNAVAITERRDGTAGGELPFNVLAPVGDRFYPTIRLFDHATISLNTAAILLSGKVVMPSRDTILMTG